ncbi:MAG: hypothetical protein JJ974_10285 [Phycisphaerales bacterium]|nr:hypothetical protein [Phycisphaerales bacterium]
MVDKNEAFCALASIDEVPVILNHDLSDSGFCDSFRTACPGGADYFFAKGILNIYSHTEKSQYRAVVDLLTRSIRSAGVWIPYNVDRVNGHQSDLLELSESAFREAGWIKIDVPVSLHRLIGIDYPSEVHSGLWIHRGVD